MLHFENDYNEGVHPKLLEALTKANGENLRATVWTPIAKKPVKKLRMPVRHQMPRCFS